MRRTLFTALFLLLATRALAQSGDVAASDAATVAREPPVARAAEPEPEAAATLAPPPGQSGAPRARARNGSVSPAAPMPEAPEEREDTTPRDALTHFLDAARAGAWTEAAEVMHPPGRPLRNAEATAQALKAVLDRHVWAEPESLSDRPEGRLDDGLAPQFEEIARIPAAEGPEPVRLVRLSSGRWIFSRETLSHVPAWQAALGTHWLREQMPPALRRSAPLDLEWWQWIALPAAILLSVLVGRLLGIVVHALLRALSRRTAAALDDQLIERLRRPRDLALVALVTLAAVPHLELSARVSRWVDGGAKIALFVAVLWGLLRALDVVTAGARASRYVQLRPAMVGLLPLGTTLGKMALLAIWILIVMQWFGLPAASVFASLGIGGLAVALAAKTTLENLLSAVTLAVDQPFRPGDFIKVEDLAGTVEAVGLRSTRIRTLDRTLVSVPNGKLADMRIESYAARDRMRLACVLPLVISTNGDQIRTILSGIEAALRAHPLIWADDLAVNLKAIGAYGLEVEVMAWFRTAVWSEFVPIRQQMYLDFVQIVREAGSDLAYPTQTLRLG